MLTRISAAGIIEPYRYWLARIWKDDMHKLVICMLNPSTADEEKDDPTIQALMDFAFAWGFGGIIVVNWRAFRTSSPEEMFLEDDANGPKNNGTITIALEYASKTSGMALAAWGNHAPNEQHFTREARRLGVRLVCLGQTQDGSPKHPLARGLHRIPRDQQPIDWIPHECA